MASDDPEFEEKAAEIIGFYLKPPVNAAVFCVDEKSAIQALDRLDPVLPLSPGRAKRHGFAYFRHGTLSHYARWTLALATSRQKPQLAKGCCEMVFPRGCWKRRADEQLPKKFFIFVIANLLTNRL
jgi:hypothetical protein